MPDIHHRMPPNIRQFLLALQQAQNILAEGSMSLYKKAPHLAEELDVWATQLGAYLENAYDELQEEGASVVSEGDDLELMFAQIYADVLAGRIYREDLVGALRHAAEGAGYLGKPILDSTLVKDAARAYRRRIKR